MITWQHGKLNLRYFDWASPKRAIYGPSHLLSYQLLRYVGVAAVPTRPVKQTASVLDEQLLPTRTGDVGVVYAKKAHARTRLGRWQAAAFQEPIHDALAVRQVIKAVALAEGDGDPTQEAVRAR